MSKNAFDKFINPKVSGAKKKEEIRQEKKKVKAELRAKANEERQQNENKYGLVTKQTREQAAKNPPADAGYQSPKAEDRRYNTGARPPASKGAAGKNKADFDRPRSSKDARPPRKTFGQDKPDAANNAPWNKQAKGPATSKRFAKNAAGPVEGEDIPATTKNLTVANELMPLNKYVAHAGVCARREAAALVKDGHVMVNGDIVYEPGYKVSARDKVEVKGKPVFLQRNLVYILLNKPKDYITTAKDPEGRKTVFDLVKYATKERIYPVGRLDRNTTGVLLMTNDGELAQKLTHPSFEIKKIYEVRLDKPLAKKDAEAILAGVTLEDGQIQADAIGYADAKDKSIIGIEIHSGRNRIVRRLFEFLGYDVKNLDRVMFANLTKKNVDRGKWRMLTEKEIRLLKFMNQSFVRSKKEA